MKTLLVLLLTVTSALADLGVTVYNASAGTGKTTTAGCSFVSFNMSGFTGTIGNASFSNNTFNLPIQSAFQSGSGQRLSAIPYSYSSGTLIITEVR